tara:strand:- start:545 stop:745 length:201 start_codon:yes stop_codon:yes gene_type:complete
MTKSEIEQIGKAMRESYLDRVTDRAAMKYLAEKAMQKRELKRINRETAFIALSVAVVFALLWIVFK